MRYYLPKDLPTYSYLDICLEYHTLFWRKSRFTLKEAAALLSKSFNQDTSEADILRLAIDDKLTLSIDFIHGTTATKLKTTESEHVDNIVHTIFDVYDLQMRGAVPNIIKSKYHELLGDASYLGFGFKPPIYVEKEGVAYQLLTKLSEKEYAARLSGKGEKIKTLMEAYKASSPLNCNIKHYTRPLWLPDDSVLVVRSEALRLLIKQDALIKQLESERVYRLKTNESATASFPQFENTDDKPWLIQNSEDPPPDQPWYTPARYFAREIIGESPKLLANRNLLTPEIVKRMGKVGIKKRGGKELHSPDTVKNALKNVTLS